MNQQTGKPGRNKEFLPSTSRVEVTAAYFILRFYLDVIRLTTKKDMKKISPIGNV